MRFSDRLTIYHETGGGYNPETGKNDDPTKVDKTLPCKLSTLGLNRTQELFGELDTTIIVARLQRPYTDAITSVEIKEGLYKGKYKLAKQSNYRKGALYLVGA